MANHPKKPPTTGYNQRKKECERRKKNDRFNFVPNAIVRIATLGMVEMDSHDSRTCPFCKRGTCNK